MEKEIFDKVSKIDTLIVTHIDNDHVNGVIKLLLDEKCPKINEIYFNGVEQIFENITINNEEIDRTIERQLKAFACECDNIETTIPVGYAEGTSLSYLIKEKGINCNSIVSQEAIYREKLKEFYSNKIKFTIISPTQDDLNELKQNWLKSLNEKKIRPKILTKSYSEAFELFVKNIIDSHTENFNINATSHSSIESLATTPYFPDPSLTNKSSFAFLIEYGDKKILYLGDCHVETIISWLDMECIETLEVDLIKISHHGSKNNTNLDLLRRIKSKKYFISTNGNIHSHPDLETLSRIIFVNQQDEIEIYINHEVNHIPNWFINEINEKYINVKLFQGIQGVEL
ncbi:hypothetical protein QJS67_01085 [Acinetobacter radioresistens]|nr:hypothetical protein QJS67_01085 [Acinetobacter radioresistens]